MKNAKTIGIVVAAVLATILVFQNTDPITTRFLFWRRELPLAVLLLVTLAIGIALGALMLWRVREHGANAGKREPRS